MSVGVFFGRIVPQKKHQEVLRSETRFHGARVKENTDLVTAINDIDSSVIGIVATADDADSDAFP